MNVMHSARLGLFGLTMVHNALQAMDYGIGGMIVPPPYLKKQNDRSVVTLKLSECTNLVWHQQIFHINQSGEQKYLSNVGA